MISPSLSYKPQSLATLSATKWKKFSHSLPCLKTDLQQHTHQWHKVHYSHLPCQLLCSVLCKYSDFVEYANIQFRQQYFPLKILIFPLYWTISAQDTLVKTILVLHVLVVFHTSESIDLSGEVLTFWGHKKFYRSLVMRTYIESKYKYYLLAILDFILGL